MKKPRTVLISGVKHKTTNKRSINACIMSIVKEKTDQAIKILKELDVDLWLTYVRKTSEIMDPCLYFLTDESWFTWETAFIITKKGENIAICGRYDVPNVNKNIYKEIIGYDVSIREPLHEVLNRLNPQVIAVNYSIDNIAADGLTHGMWLRLNKLLEGTNYAKILISSEKILGALRGRKTPSELALIKEAIKISQEGHLKITEKVKLGMTEKDIEKILMEHTIQKNVKVSYPPLINVGSDTAIGHGRGLSHIKVKQGDLINIDYGVFYQGYASDIQRLSYALRDGENEPPEEIKKAFQIVVKAITKSSEFLRPSVMGWEVDSIARKIVIDGGYPEFMHALGHQIGRNVHDGGCLLGPKWEKYGELPFMEVEEGQVFTLELHVFLENHGFCSLEEDVLVTAEGCQFLSDRQTELKLLKF
ncbi:Xaa-Pro dipeptidase [subsurface metagenome]